VREVVIPRLALADRAAALARSMSLMTVCEKRFERSFV
jgi:hypothetical protein